MASCVCRSPEARAACLVLVSLPGRLPRQRLPRWARELRCLLAVVQESRHCGPLSFVGCRTVRRYGQPVRRPAGKAQRFPLAETG